jgi:hypothetical protein
VKASLQRVIAALHRLKEENVSILLASLDMKLESKERNGLFPKLASAMDEAFHVTDSDEGQHIVRENRIEYNRRDAETQRKIQ